MTKQLTEVEEEKRIVLCRKELKMWVPEVKSSQVKELILPTQTQPPTHPRDVAIAIFSALNRFVGVIELLKA